MTNMMIPQLAAPGAGLPAIELFFGRQIFALKCLTGNRETFSAQFERERTKIRSMVKSCPQAKRGEQVLIRRLQGLEDSSRYWSLWMTLDHLRITNLAFAGIISELTNGRIPHGTASTAAVKPDPVVGSEVESEYEKSCADLLSLIASSTKLKTAIHYRHPWFGPLDASRWHALSAMHMGIHRAQIAAIINGLTG